MPNTLPAPKGRRIALFGGSFDPPHAGHLHVVRTALDRIGVDAVWWLPAPQNPLKSHHPQPPQVRIASIRALQSQAGQQFAARTSICLDAIAYNEPYTFRQLIWLRRKYPRIRFVMVAGADTAQALRHFRHPHRCLAMVPWVFVPRPSVAAPSRGIVVDPMLFSRRKFSLVARRWRRGHALQAGQWGWVAARGVAAASRDIRLQR